MCLQYNRNSCLTHFLFNASIVLSKRHQKGKKKKEKKFSHVIVGMMEQSLPYILGYCNLGLCFNYLADREKGQQTKVYFFLGGGTFKYRKFHLILIEFFKQPISALQVISCNF